MHEKGEYIHIVYSYKTLDFRNCEKSTCAIDCLNLANDEKSTLAGSEFHTLTNSFSAETASF